LTFDATKAYIVSIVTNHAPLGEFEVVVLMAVLQLADDAFGTSVRDEIATRAERPVSRGAVYVTLDRLEAKGLLASRLDRATPSRGGRRKRLFRVTPAGLRRVRQSVTTIVKMHDGLAPLLGDM
jgi:DNA-binding PadR family transcriptional regulator